MAPKNLKKILFIEDDPFIQDIYLTQLKAAGFDARGADDGEKALKILEKFQPDLLLLDIILPGMDGWDLLRKIRQDKVLKNTKVVVLSNLEQKSEIDKSVGLGVERFFIKAHYTPREVVEKIQAMLENSSKE